MHLWVQGLHLLGPVPTLNTSTLNPCLLGIFAKIQK